MNHDVYCQSCSMPMGAPEDYGTEKDGAQSAKFCKYCYDKGAFTWDCTLEQMINECVGHMCKDHPEMTEQGVRELLEKVMPNLDRWRKG